MPPGGASWSRLRRHSRVAPQQEWRPAGLEPPHICRDTCEDSLEHARVKFGRVAARLRGLARFWQAFRPLPGLARGLPAAVAFALRGPIEPGARGPGFALAPRRFSWHRPVHLRASVAARCRPSRVRVNAMPIAPRATASYTRPEMPQREEPPRRSWAAGQPRAYGQTPSRPYELVAAYQAPWPGRVRSLAR